MITIILGQKFPKRRFNFKNLPNSYGVWGIDSNGVPFALSDEKFLKDSSPNRPINIQAPISELYIIDGEFNDGIYDEKVFVGVIIYIGDGSKYEDITSLLYNDTLISKRVREVELLLKSKKLRGDPGLVRAWAYFK